MNIFVNTFLCKFFLVVNNNKSENLLLTISYSERLTRLTYDNIWRRISMSINYFISFSLKQQQKVKICCWQYHFRNVLPDKPMTILENTFKCKFSIWLLFNRKLQQIVRICCWQYHFRNVLPDKPMTILENTFKCKLINWLFFNRKLQQIVRLCCWQYHIRNVLPD